MKDAICIEWDTASQQQWDRLLHDSPYAALQQSYSYGEVISRLGGMVYRAQIFSGDTCIAVAQVHTKKVLEVFTIATIMMGPVWLQEQVLEAEKSAVYRALRKTLPVGGLHILLLMPDASVQSRIGAAEKRTGLKRVVSSYHTVLIDLAKGEEELLAQMNGKWRNRLRAAEKAGVTISKVGRRPEQYGWLLEQETRQRRRIGYRAHAPKVVTLFQEYAGKDSVFTLEARDGTQQCGGMLFLLHGNTATYHIGWASEAGRHHNVHNLLLWEAIKRLKKKGICTLDLGGVDTDHVAGIARFKLGAGGELVSQSGTWCLKPALR